MTDPDIGSTVLDMDSRISNHRKTTLTVLGFGLLVAASFFLGTGFAAAANDNTNTAVNNTGSAARNAAAGRLEAAKLRVCQQREQAMNKIMSRMADRADRQVTLFTTIAVRVETFYSAKGRPLSTYDALVAEVSEKKSAATAQILNLKASSTFVCTADNPKGLAAAFKGSLRATITALQNYKTAVKNLIVGVKSAQGQASSANDNVNTANSNSSTD